MQTKKFITSVAAALPMTWILCHAAHAGELENTVRVGYAKIRFKLQSGDLTGPPGTTPPGLKIDAKDQGLLAVSYERRLSANWVAQFQGGIPPTLTAVGAGVAVPVGTVAKARIWFPTALMQYTFPDFHGIRPHVGMGVVYTFFTNQEVSNTYTGLLQGSSSTIALKSSWSPYGRLGLSYPIDKHWAVSMEAGLFRLKTSAQVVTQTPGYGAIPRSVALTDRPQIFGLTLGYKF
ncbi:OmpW family protein [Pseudoduganella sp. LjRoot289]|uniref:OmpW/AlkL family protein n=1 Tax=Pseudoduganella sp. LjRoot289 TaxID=3342314 RepID=UPI003ECFED8A